MAKLRGWALGDVGLYSPRPGLYNTLARCAACMNARKASQEVVEVLRSPQHPQGPLRQ